MARTTPTQPLPRPLPRELVRDLLGITRALYRAENAKANPERARLQNLEEIGQQYRRALDMAAQHGPGTMAGRAALSWAEKATEELGAYVADSEPIAAAVAATASRLRRARSGGRSA